MKESGRGTSAINKLGDGAFYICINGSPETTRISFEFSCSLHKRKIAQQIFLNLPFIVHEHRNKPIVVTKLKAAKDALYVLRRIFEHGGNKATTPLWSWTQSDLEIFFYNQLLKTPETADRDAELYSSGRINDYVAMLNYSHNFKLEGKCQDGLSFPITINISKQLFARRLREMGITYTQWRQGKHFKTIPLGIASMLLTKAIEILESEPTKIASCLFRAYRQHNTFRDQSWFSTATRPADIVEHSLQNKKDPTGILAQLGQHGPSKVNRLPWASKMEFNEFQTLIHGAALTVFFSQGGHRFSELTSTLSTETKTLQGRMFVRQSLDKEHKGLRLYRPLASLSAATAHTMWNLSYLDPKKTALPLFHHMWKPAAKCTTSVKGSSYGHMALTKRLNKFYYTLIIPHIPEAAKEHPKLSFHQFRHTFAEFVLRRFDEDVHADLREHYMHLSDHVTRVYEERKLTKEILFRLEMDYLHEIIGKVAEGKLDNRYWGPAFKRLQALVKQVKILSPGEANEWYEKISDQIERFAVFEWGFCVLFSSSKSDAKCHDSISGLPDVDGQASAGRCTGCPNNMGNTIQRNNLIRIAAAHSAIGDTHPIRAIGKISRDIAEQISRRIGA